MPSPGSCFPASCNKYDGDPGLIDLAFQVLQVLAVGLGGDLPAFQRVPDELRRGGGLLENAIHIIFF